MIQYVIEFGERIGLQHSHTRVAEIGYPLKQGRCSQVAAYVQDAAILIYSVDAFVDLAAQQTHLVVRVKALYR